MSNMTWLRISAVLLVVVFVLILTGCGGSDDPQVAKWWDGLSNKAQAGMCALHNDNKSFAYTFADRRDWDTGTMYRLMNEECK